MSRRGEESMNRQGMHTYIDGVCSVCGDPGDCKHAYEIDEGADATCVDTGLMEGKHC